MVGAVFITPGARRSELHLVILNGLGPQISRGKWIIDAGRASALISVVSSGKGGLGPIPPLEPLFPYAQLLEELIRLDPEEAQAELIGLHAHG